VYPDGDQGWNYIASDAVTISTAEGRMLRANLTVLQHARGRQEAVLYWYQRGETSFGDDYGYRLALLESNLMLRETSAVVVRISTMLRGPSLAASFEAEEHLAALLFSAVRSSWL
jgi:EpsI family protein